MASVWDELAQLGQPATAAPVASASPWDELAALGSQPVPQSAASMQDSPGYRLMAINKGYGLPETWQGQGPEGVISRIASASLPQVAATGLAAIPTPQTRIASAALPAAEAAATNQQANDASYILWWDRFGKHLRGPDGVLDLTQIDKLPPMPQGSQIARQEFTPEEVDAARQYILSQQVERDYHAARGATIPGKVAEGAMKAMPVIAGYGAANSAIQAATSSVGPMTGAIVATGTAGLPGIVEGTLTQTADTLSIDKDGNVITQEGKPIEEVLPKEIISSLVVNRFLGPWRAAGGTVQEFQSLLTQGGPKAIGQTFLKLEAARVVNIGLGVQGEAPRGQIDTKSLMDPVEPLTNIATLGLAHGVEAGQGKISRIVEEIRTYRNRNTAESLPFPEVPSRTDLKAYGITEQTTAPERQAIAEAVNASEQKPPETPILAVQEAALPENRQEAIQSPTAEAVQAEQAPAVPANPYADRVEELAARRMTTKQIADALVSESENGMTAQAARAIVMQVRQERGIPAMDGGPTFETWRKNRGKPAEQAVETEPVEDPVAAAVAEEPVAPEAAPETNGKMGGNGQIPPEPEKAALPDAPVPGRDFALQRAEIEPLLDPNKITSPERQHAQEWLQEAVDKGYDNPDTAIELVETANRTKRDMSKVEIMGVAGAVVHLRAKREALVREADSMPEGLEKERKISEIAIAQRQLEDVLLPSLEAGTEWHRQGMARQAFLRMTTPDALPDVLMQARVARKRPLTDKETAEITKLHEENQALRDEVSKLTEERNAQASSELLFSKRKNKSRKLNEAERETEANALAKLAAELLAAGCDPS